MDQKELDKKNIIVFPKNKRASPPNSIDEINKNIEEARKYKIDLDIDEFLKISEEYFNELGYDIGIEENLKSYAVFVESLTSLVYKSVGYTHPFQILSEELVKIKNEEDFEELVKIKDEEDS
jgi:hypothetical protein